MKSILPTVALAILVVVFTTETACSQIPSQTKHPIAESNKEVKLPAAPEKSSKLLKPDGLVNDYAGVLNNDAKQQIEAVVAELQKKAKVDFGLAIIRSTNGEKIFDYSLAVAKDWKIGSENGGILLMVAIEDRNWHIQINKRLEQDLTNEEVKQIGDAMIPYFREKKYTDGLKKCLETMIMVFAEKQKFDPIKF